MGDESVEEGEAEVKLAKNKKTVKNKKKKVSEEEKSAEEENEKENEEESESEENAKKKAGNNDKKKVVNKKTAKNKKKKSEGDERESEEEKKSKKSAKKKGEKKKKKGGRKREESGEDSEEHDEYCKKCKEGGKLLMCECCPNVFHLKCASPPLKSLPKGAWFCGLCACAICQQKSSGAKENSLYSCYSCERILHVFCMPKELSAKSQLRCKECVDHSGDIQSILTWRMAHKESKQSPKQSKRKRDKKEEKKDERVPSSVEEWKRTEFLVKWKDRSHIDDAWVSYSWARVCSTTLVANFCKNPSLSLLESEIIKSDWTKIAKVLNESKVKANHYLVQWKSLPLTEVTYEPKEWVEHNFPEKVEEYRERKRKALENKVILYRAQRDTTVGEPKREFVEFKKQPSFIKGGELHPHQLDGLNWLLYSWSKKTNAILADEMGLGNFNLLSFFFKGF